KTWSCSDAPPRTTWSKLDVLRHWLLCGGEAPEDGALEHPDLPDVFPDPEEMWAVLAQGRMIRYEILGINLTLLTHKSDRMTESHVIPGLSKDEYGIRALAASVTAREPMILDVGGHIWMSEAT
ncbi:unnamed protein product, partial [Polarella glacialis]